MMYQSICSELQPSICAASSMSRGMPRWELHQHTKHEEGIGRERRGQDQRRVGVDHVELLEHDVLRMRSTICGSIMVATMIANSTFLPKKSKRERVGDQHAGDHRHDDARDHDQGTSWRSSA